MSSAIEPTVYPGGLSSAAQEYIKKALALAESSATLEFLAHYGRVTTLPRKEAAFIHRQINALVLGCIREDGNDNIEKIRSALDLIVLDAVPEVSEDQPKERQV